MSKLQEKNSEKPNFHPFLASIYFHFLLQSQNTVFQLSFCVDIFSDNAVDLWVKDLGYAVMQSQIQLASAVIMK
jgi:hypothetical protein